MISYFPGFIKSCLLNFSMYDVLCEIFFIRSFTTMIYNVIAPFLHCHSPDEAREVLDSMKENNQLTKKMHKILFTKGLINNLPKKYRNLVMPKDK